MTARDRRSPAARAIAAASASTSPMTCPRAAERGGDAADVPAEVGRRVQVDTSSAAASEPASVCWWTPMPHRRRARLEHGEDPRATDARAQRLQGRRDRGRVVGEIVEHGDAAHPAAQLHAPAGVAKARPAPRARRPARRRRPRPRAARRVHSRRCGRRSAPSAPRRRPARPLPDLEVRTSRGERARTCQSAGGAAAEALDRRPGAELERGGEFAVVGVDDQPAARPAPCAPAGGTCARMLATSG